MPLSIVSLTKRLKLKLLEQKPNIQIYLLIIIYTIVCSYISILKHNAFLSSAWDLGIFEQAIWSTVNRGELFWYCIDLPINPSGSFFGIHFSPILFLVLPVYRAFQTTETLLVLQSFLIALGALPLYWIVGKDVNRRAALIFAAVYLLYPPLHGVNLFDFHPHAFLPAFFLFAYHYFRERKWIKYFIFVILALTVIEFVPFIVVFLGFYGLWMSRKELASVFKLGIRKTLTNKRIICSIITIILGICWFILAMRVIFHFNPSPRPHPNWQRFGDPIHDLSGVIFSMLSNPLYSIQVAFTPLHEKFAYIVGLFGPVAVLSFLDLPSLMIGAPWFVASLLSNYPPYYRAVGYQYVAFVIPFIFISAFHGVKRLATILSKIAKREAIVAQMTKNVFVVMMCISILSVATIGTTLQVPQITLHHRALEKMVQLIPPDVSVLTQNNVFPHLSRRLYCYVGSNPVGNFSNTNFDFILVDTTSGWYVGGYDFIQFPLTTVVPKVFESGEYGLIAAVDGIWLLKKDFNGKSIFLMEGGIFGKFYDASYSTGKAVFESVFLDTEWDWTWQPPFPTTNNSEWSAIFSSFLYTPITGAYQFGMSVSGVCKLYINDKQVLDLNGTVFQETDAIILQKGSYYSIRIEYTKASNPGILKVSWKTPLRDSYEKISYDNLFWNTSSYGE